MKRPEIKFPVFFVSFAEIRSLKSPKTAITKLLHLFSLKPVRIYLAHKLRAAIIEDLEGIYNGKSIKV
jgi:hypothetical protein